MNGRSDKGSRRGEHWHRDNTLPKPNLHGNCDNKGGYYDESGDDSSAFSARLEGLTKEQLCSAIKKADKQLVYGASCILHSAIQQEELAFTERRRK